MDKWNGNNGKRTDPPSETATLSAPKPGDYPLGSLESRAAARAIVDSKKREETVIQVVFVSPDGTRENGPLLRVPARPHRR